MEVREGDWVLLYHSEEVKAVAKAVRGARVATIRGAIRLDDVVGALYGSRVRSTLGEEFVVFPATIVDVLSRFRKVTQVMHPKDIAQVLMYAGIGPGSKVIEVGLGSGYLTAVTAWYVRPDGVVYAYERRPDVARVGWENISSIGLDRWVILRIRDVVAEGFEERGVDAVVLDMADPWRALDHAHGALRPGGSLAAYLTTVDQLVKFVGALDGRRFVDWRLYDVALREWKVVKGELRPRSWALAHTGYVFLARQRP